MTDIPKCVREAQEEINSLKKSLTKWIGIAVENQEEIERLKAENQRYREALDNLIYSLEAVHDDPEYRTVWALYQSHVPTGYKGRTYTQAFDEAKALTAQLKPGDPPQDQPQISRTF